MGGNGADLHARAAGRTRGPRPAQPAHAGTLRSERRSRARVVRERMQPVAGWTTPAPLARRRCRGPSGVVHRPPTV